MKARVAIAGAGIYGATAAIKLAQRGHAVTLFDPLGMLQAASGINQYRVHAGYHYPRSRETILEVQEARSEFLNEFAAAIVGNAQHLYAIPKCGSLTSADDFVRIMKEFSLPLVPKKPNWMDFSFIERCWQVDEALYDPERLRDLLKERLDDLGVALERRFFTEEETDDWDFIVWATYGLSKTRKILPNTRVQVAEKVLIRLPAHLRQISLVVVDGPFTAFDPYGSSELSLFGSAKFTNHWATDNPFDTIPEPFRSELHRPEFRPVPFTRFGSMMEDCALAVPAACEAEYLGSRFALRVVEHDPEGDRRVLYVRKLDLKNIGIFSGKVVGAVKAARMITDLVENGSQP